MTSGVIFPIVNFKDQWLYISGEINRNTNTYGLQARKLEYMDLMEYSKINGYEISKLTLGTVALGLNYGISNSDGKPSRKESFEILSTALNLGINTIDTARTYGDAELLTGSFLELYQNSKPTIVTKFVVSDENLLNKDLIRKEIYQSVNSSRQFLKLDRIPICLFHKGKDQNIDHVLDVLSWIFEDLKNDGLIDLAGISAYYPSELERILDYPIFEALQVPVSIFDQRIIAHGSLKRAFQQNKLVFARSVFLQGLFFMDPDKLTGNLKIAKPYLAAINDLAIRAKMSVAQLAFSYVRDLEGVASIVFGATTASQVQENVNLLSGAKIPMEINESIRELFEDMPAEVITPALWKV